MVIKSSQSGKLASLALDIRSWAREIGFDAIGISDIDLGKDEKYLEKWLQADRHGEMAYMTMHGENAVARRHSFQGQCVLSPPAPTIFPKASIARRNHWQTQPGVMSHGMHLGVTTTRLYGGDCRPLPTGLRGKSVNSDTEPSPTVPRYWRRRLRKRPDWAGSANIQT